MENVLVVIDMQNDFIDGSLANRDAISIVDKIAELVSRWNGKIIFTRDTHYANYMDTQEGKNLPVPHCIFETDGWRINNKIDQAAISNKKAKVAYVDKLSFGAGEELFNAIQDNGSIKEITICGTCTDICVVSNALILKSRFIETPIILLEKLCAGLTREKHNAAIEVMKSCQIIIK